MANQTKWFGYYWFWASFKIQVNWYTMHEEGYGVLAHCKQCGSKHSCVPILPVGLILWIKDLGLSQSFAVDGLNK